MHTCFMFFSTDFREKERMLAVYPICVKFKKFNELETDNSPKDHQRNVFFFYINKLKHFWIENRLAENAKRIASRSVTI